jgi:hypothetical protein
MIMYKVGTPFRSSNNVVSEIFRDQVMHWLAGPCN